MRLLFAPLFDGFYSGAEHGARFDAGEARVAPPHDGGAGRRIAGTSETATESCNLDQVGGERFLAGRSIIFVRHELVDSREKPR